MKLRLKKLMIIFTITSLPKKMSLKLFGFLRSLNFNLFLNRPEDFMIRELQAAEEEKAKAVRKALNKKISLFSSHLNELLFFNYRNKVTRKLQNLRPLLDKVCVCDF